MNILFEENCRALAPEGKLEEDMVASEGGALFVTASVAIGVSCEGSNPAAALD